MRPEFDFILNLLPNCFRVSTEHSIKDTWIKHQISYMLVPVNYGLHFVLGLTICILKCHTV